jgi:hypothetical protein
VLPDDDVVHQQQFLLVLNVNVKIRVMLVEVVKMDVGDLPNPFDQHLINPGPFQGRVGKENEYFGHGVRVNCQWKQHLSPLS